MDDRIPAEKRRLRAELRVIRANIAADPADRAARSARIWARILPLVREHRRVMLFDALPTEPDTGPWQESLRERGIEVFLPEVDGPDLRVMPGDADPATLDAVIVPGLAFTTDGRRLGQGGGHFDRFLPRLPEACVTIGVCFHEQLVAELPIAVHDARVDLVVSD
jgi:5-formyltetrahydrofolate cyclo-ligase